MKTNRCSGAWIPTALLLLMSCGPRYASAAGTDATQTQIPNYSGVQKEQLGRGLTAVHNGDGTVSIGWRYLESDPTEIAFDLYRQTGRKAPVKLNDAPLTRSTFFKETGVNTAAAQTYTLRLAGSNDVLPGGEFVLTPERARQPWISIPVAEVPGDPDFAWTPNDASTADLDGDGEYELVVKREIRGYDNSQRGMSDGVLLEAYRLDGTLMWRVDLGPNIRGGAHYTQLMVYDFDGDGRGEIAVKTSEGTLFGDGTKIGDTDGDGVTDYVDRDESSRTYGMILRGPEFLSVIEGATGKELARTGFIPRGGEFDFGDNSGNRVDRFLGGAGYFDGKRPSILLCRGYYAKTVVEAWDYRDGTLTRRWTFDTTADNGRYKEYEGMGNHNLSIGDVDGDGRDEVVYGAMLIDDNGTPGYRSTLGHGDAMHLTDIDIDRPGLEVWQCHEGSPSRAGSEMRDARTGALIWGIPSIEDVGRALAADLDPRFRGLEVWTSSSPGIYTAEGRFITERKPSVNMAVWWDGDLNRELLDRAGSGRNQFMAVTKWNGDGIDTLYLPGQYATANNNGTKGNPCLSADLLGDWREEVVVRTRDNREIRIYMTDYPTDYRFHTLMNDKIYRWSVLTQNIAYNQPTQLGHYLGSDLGRFWPTRRRLVTTGGKSGVAADGRPNGMNARQAGSEEIVQREIVTDRISYTLDARADYDSYEWTVNGQPVAAGRTLTLDQAAYGYDTPVTIGIRATLRGFVFEDSGTLTFVKEMPRRR
jgi:rhamnogalacturonan endolyase